MLVQIRDRAAMDALPIVNLRAYLNSQGWIDIGAWGERPITVFAKEEGERTWEILVPHTDNIGGYAENMAESIAVLATVEDRSQLNVYYDLLGAGADTIRVRSMNGAAGESLSLRRRANLLSDAYRMLSSAARAAEKPQAVFRGPISSEVVEYLDNVRPLPGYQEGYAITLHSPVPAGFGTQQDFGDDYIPPFPRQVTTRLASALRHSSAAVSRAVVSDTLEPFREAVPNGVSANLCSSIAELAKKGGGVEIDLTWGKVRPSDVPTVPLRFSERSADVLTEAARLFRRDEPLLNEAVIGHIVKLEREITEFDGRATVVYVRRGRPIRMQATFEESAYDTVIRAFDDRVPVSVDGDVYRVGNTYELRNPRNLSLVAEETQ